MSGGFVVYTPRITGRQAADPPAFSLCFPHSEIYAFADQYARVRIMRARTRPGLHDALTPRAGQSRRAGRWRTAPPRRRRGSLFKRRYSLKRAATFSRLGERRASKMHSRSADRRGSSRLRAAVPRKLGGALGKSFGLPQRPAMWRF